MSAPSDKGEGADNTPASPPNWAKFFTALYCHTNLSRHDIHEASLPELEAVLGEVQPHIAWKAALGALTAMFGITTGSGSASQKADEAPVPTGKAPKLSAFAAFAGEFSNMST
jgi:hypothetical protein